MFIKQLALLNFKNYLEINLDFSPKINCFTGNNGVGKTNLLDAIYYLSFCKSNFNPIDSQNILNDEDFFMIQGYYLRKNMEENIQVGVKRGQKKTIKRNKKEYTTFSEHIGLLPLVMKSPADSDFIHLGSEERRKLPDSVISQFDAGYLDALIQYNRILTQRNKLLKQHQAASQQLTFQIYDEQLAGKAEEIYTKRKTFIEEITPVFQTYYRKISLDREQVSFLYESHLSQGDLAKQLESNFQKDIVLQYTSKGIHRDDLQLLLNNQPIRKFGSQGQQKTFLIALKLAQYQFIREKTGLRPILLLDDIFDKLDNDRVERIIKIVTTEEFGQIFITDTNPERISKLLEADRQAHRLFHIDEAGIRIMNDLPA